MGSLFFLLTLIVIWTSGSAEGACTGGKWQCKNGSCVLREKVCDTVEDCEDGSDEAEVCQVLESGQCPHFLFSCHDNKQCISQVKVGNDIKDCQDGSDEKEKIKEVKPEETPETMDQSSSYNHSFAANSLNKLLFSFNLLFFV